MPRYQRVVKFFVCLSLMALLVSGCTPKDPTPGGEGQGTPVRRYTFVSGPTGGTWYPFAAAASEIAMNTIEGLNITVSESGGAGNIRIVEDGRDGQIGIANVPQLWDALEGTGLFEGEAPAKNLRCMMLIETNYAQFVVRKGVNINKLADLATAKYNVFPGGQGLSVELLFRAALENVGVDYDDIRAAGGKLSFTSYSEMVDGMRDGNCDIFAVAGPCPHPSILELQATTPFKLLSLSDEELESFCSQNNGYFVQTIHPNTYEGQPDPVYTIGQPNVMICSADVPEDVVYDMVKALIENKARLAEVNQGFNFISLENSSKGLPEELMHPGALKYFKEMGIQF